MAFATVNASYEKGMHAIVVLVNVQGVQNRGPIFKWCALSGPHYYKHIRYHLARPEKFTGYRSVGRNCLKVSWKPKGTFPDSPSLNFQHETWRSGWLTGHSCKKLTPVQTALWTVFKVEMYFVYLFSRNTQWLKDGKKFIWLWLWLQSYFQENPSKNSWTLSESVGVPGSQQVYNTMRKRIPTRRGAITSQIDYDYLPYARLRSNKNTM